MSELTISYLVIYNNVMKMTVTTPGKTSSLYEVLSEEYKIEGMVNFQMRLINLSKQTYNNSYGSTYNNAGSKIGLFVKFDNLSTYNAKPIIKFTIDSLDIKNICLPSDSIWHLIDEGKLASTCFDIHFTVEMKQNNTQFQLMYDDNELTDFEVLGENGSVRVHKCILAASSSVFKTMILGDWKESNCGYVKFEGIKKQTLEDFKKFIYHQELHSVSEELLLLAMQYMMPDMEQLCINILIESINAAKVSDLLDFAAVHKCDKLKLALIEYLQCGIIKASEIKQSLLKTPDDMGTKKKRKKTC